uniref:SP140 nuclear body protein n=1 Tax=Molossus molossus TaxID=27622 RepID=A0A7J8FVJ5_MOLMO|nr:SP140 nuclear body protein [Molossus molossus]
MWILRTTLLWENSRGKEKRRKGMPGPEIGGKGRETYSKQEQSYQRVETRGVPVSCAPQVILWAQNQSSQHAEMRSVPVLCVPQKMGQAVQKQGL